MRPRYTRIKIEKKNSTRLVFMGTGTDEGTSKADIFFANQTPDKIIKCMTKLVYIVGHYMAFDVKYLKMVTVTGCAISYNNDVRSVFLICRADLPNGKVFPFNTYQIPEESENPDTITMTEDYVKAVDNLIAAAEEFRTSPAAELGPLFAGMDGKELSDQNVDEFIPKDEAAA